jgi:hypothetical protein
VAFGFISNLPGTVLETFALWKSMVLVLAMLSRDNVTAGFLLLGQQGLGRCWLALALTWCGHQADGQQPVGRRHSGVIRASAGTETPSFLPLLGEAQCVPWP